MQEEAACKELAQEVEAHYLACKQWLARFEAVEDFNNLEAVRDLITSGSS